MSCFFKANLLDNIELMKNDISKIEDVKEYLKEMPDDFNSDKEVLLKVFQTFPVISRCNDAKIKDEILKAFQALFHHVEDFGEAVVTYFDSCSELDNGPFGINNFSIDQYINEIESFYENREDISLEVCLEPSKLLAWALIGDTKECLKHFCVKIVLQNSFIHFLSYMFEHIQAVCRYEAKFMNVKGSLLLLTFREIIQEHPTNLDTIQHLLLRLTFPRKQNQLSLVEPQLLYEEILFHLLQKEMIDFWIHIFSDFIRRLKKNNIEIKWDFESGSLKNPINLCVFLIKILYADKYPGFDADELFKNLGYLFNAQNVVFSDTTALKCCDDIDWATKFTLLQYLQIPFSSYRREIPAALYSVLSKDQKLCYVNINDSKATMENYFTCIFELAFISGHVPDEFIDGGVHFSQMYDLSSHIALCLYRAYRNVLLYRDVIINENIYEVIRKVFKVFDCRFDCGGAYPTLNLINALMDLQPCLIIGRAAVAAIYDYRNRSLTKSLTSDYRKLDDAVKRFLSIFFAVATKFLDPFYDELQDALNNVNRTFVILSSKLSIMGAFHVLLKKITNALSKILDNPPKEMELFLNRLHGYICSYNKYMQKTYPHFDIKKVAPIDESSIQQHQQYQVYQPLPSFSVGQTVAHQSAPNLSANQHTQEYQTENEPPFSAHSKIQENTNSIANKIHETEVEPPPSYSFDETKTYGRPKSDGFGKVSKSPPPDFAQLSKEMGIHGHRNELDSGAFSTQHLNSFHCNTHTDGRTQESHDDIQPPFSAHSKIQETTNSIADQIHETEVEVEPPVEPPQSYSFDETETYQIPIRSFGQNGTQHNPIHSFEAETQQTSSNLFANRRRRFTRESQAEIQPPFPTHSNIQKTFNLFDDQIPEAGSFGPSKTYQVPIPSFGRTATNGKPKTSGFAKISKSPPPDFAQLSKEMGLRVHRDLFSTNLEAPSTPRPASPPLNYIYDEIQTDGRNDINAEIETQQTSSNLSVNQHQHYTQESEEEIQTPFSTHSNIQKTFNLFDDQIPEAGSFGPSKTYQVPIPSFGRTATNGKPKTSGFAKISKSPPPDFAQLSKEMGIRVHRNLFSTNLEAPSTPRPASPPLNYIYDEIQTDGRNDINAEIETQQTSSNLSVNQHQHYTQESEIQTPFSTHSEIQENTNSIADRIHETEVEVEPPVEPPQDCSFDETETYQVTIRPFDQNETQHNQFPSFEAETQQPSSNLSANRYQRYIQSKIHKTQLSEEMGNRDHRNELDLETCSTPPPLNSFQCAQTDEHDNVNAEIETPPVPSPLSSPTSSSTRQIDPVIYKEKFAKLSTGIMRNYPLEMIEACALTHATICPPPQPPKYRGRYSTK